MLIGRNCPLAQIQEQVTVSDDKLTVASKTPFGWILMGDPRKNFKTAQSHLINNIASDDPEALTKAISSQPNARLPGSRRQAQRSTHHSDGINVDEELLAKIEAFVRN